MRKLRLFTGLLILLFVLGIGAMQGLVPVFAQADSPEMVYPSSQEVVQRLTTEAYQQEVQEFYEQLSDFVVVVDLENPEGIDVNLLPENVALQLDSGDKVVAYKETRHPEHEQSPDSGRDANSFSSCGAPSITGIPCASADATIDITVEEPFGSVDQFVRVLAVRYDDYPPSQYTWSGWEIEQQWAWWERSSTSWTVTNGNLWSYITGENYCTESGATLNWASNWFTPGWQTTYKTYIYTINGFPNIAYVPNTQGWSQTQGDIYQSGVLRYNNATTDTIWKNCCW